MITKGLLAMMRLGLSGRIQFTSLVLILLLLPVYSYACVLPMLGASSNANTCHLANCSLSDSQQTTQKYCDALKRVQVESSLTLQDALTKSTSGSLLTEFQITTGVPKALLALSSFEEARSFTAQNLYLLHHTLLL
jgi:hypothetical protein